MTEKKIKRAGRYVAEKKCAQVEIPATIFDAVRRHCEYRAMNLTTFWRRYIVEGYLADQRKGLIE